MPTICLALWWSDTLGLYESQQLRLAAAVVLVILVWTALFRFASRLLCIRRLVVRQSVILELTPPAVGDRAPHATRQLFAALHGLEETRPLIYKLLGWPAVFSCEVVSTRAEGVRFMVRIAASDQALLERAFIAYAPSIKVRRVKDYLGSIPAAHAQVLTFQQTGHFAYPLENTAVLSQHDPVGYLVSAMSGLQQHELVACQLVLTPLARAHTKVIVNRLLHNEERLQNLGGGHSISGRDAGRVLQVLLQAGLDALTDIVHGPKAAAGAASTHLVASDQRPTKVLSPLEQQLADAVHDKLSQPLFRTSIRAVVVADSREAQRVRLAGLRHAIGSSATSFQSLRSRPTFLNSYRFLLLRHRLPALLGRHEAVLAASEVADLFHFPHTLAANGGDVVRSLSRTLPVPPGMKRSADEGTFSVVLGQNHHDGLATNIGLTAAERERHLYVIGGTGTGKTTMLQHSIIQDIQHGRGVAVVDPHGDLAESLLRYIPEERINDVIYFKPSDLGYPIGFNLLELPEELAGDDRLEAEDFVTEAVVSMMRKVFSDNDIGGHRIEYVMRNTIHTALTVEGATLFTVFDLLTDPAFRHKVVARLESAKLRNFWNQEYGKAGTYQQVKMVAGVTSKIGRFQFSAATERVMSQATSTIDFDDILDGKILICNFAKGLLGEDTSELFGICVLAKLQLAAYRRVRQQAGSRQPFYLYVDEFQNFATKSFEQMLSEARKYKLFLTMAEQSTTQQDRQLVDIILSNVGSVVCFRTGSPTDEQVLLPHFRPYVAAGEILHLPNYQFYAKLSGVQPQEPVSGETILPDSAGSGEIAERVIAVSRKQFGNGSAVQLG